MVKTRSTATSPSDVRAKLAKHILADGYDLVFDLAGSEGSYLYDSLHGDSFLDFFSFFATNPVGLNHPGMREESFRRKLADVAIHNPSNSDIYTVEMADFVETFSREAIPKHLPHLFLVDGGFDALPTNRRGTRSGARKGRHPSRLEACQHQSRSRRSREGARLRPRQGFRRRSTRERALAISHTQPGRDPRGRAPDGRELFYLASGQLDMMAVAIETEPTFTLGTREPLFDTEPYYTRRTLRRGAIAPDGQRFLLLKEGVESEGTAAPPLVVVQNWFEELKRLVPTN